MFGSAINFFPYFNQNGNPLVKSLHIPKPPSSFGKSLKYMHECFRGVVCCGKAKLRVVDIRSIVRVVRKKCADCGKLNIAIGLLGVPHVRHSVSNMWCRR